jgi:hypothetical protein
MCASIQIGIRVTSFRYYVTRTTTTKTTWEVTILAIAVYGLETRPVTLTL